MGRRYYCDYCDKTFIDDLEARKKHLSSAQHIKLTKLHYENHRDLRTILEEESAKVPCRRFLQQGDCQFAGCCKYTHYTQEQLWDIKQQIIQQMEHKDEKARREQDEELPTIESWLEKYRSKTKNKTKAEPRDDDLNLYWAYPERLATRLDLPPSVQKFTPDTFADDHFEEWGL